MRSTIPVGNKNNHPVPRLQGFERSAWRLMRYSAILVIPLVFIHVLIQDILVGVHNIDVNYVAMRWSSLGWRIFDAFLLIFAFTHGMNGLRQVIMDYVHQDKYRTLISRLLLVIWLVISLIGAVAVIGGVGRS